MDWKKLREDALAKASEYAEKAKQMSTDVANKTRVTIKNEDEYSAFLTDRKGVLVAGSESREAYRFAILRYPELVTKAWTESATLRYLDIAVHPEFAQRFCVMPDTEIAVVLFRQGQEIGRFSTPEDVSSFFAKFTFPS